MQYLQGVLEQLNRHSAAAWLLAQGVCRGQMQWRRCGARAQGLRRHVTMQITNPLNLIRVWMFMKSIGEGALLPKAPVPAQGLRQGPLQWRPLHMPMRMRQYHHQDEVAWMLYQLMAKRNMPPLNKHV